MYSTTLHYAPCGIDGKGFQVAVVLPKGTNYPLKSKHIRIDNKTASTSNENTGSSNINEDALLAATNKWLIATPKAVLMIVHILDLRVRILRFNLLQ